MIVYSETSISILKELAKFQYLTVSQFVKLGLTKTNRGIYPVIRKVTDGNRALVKKINYTVQPGKGRPESVHYLSKRGVKFLIENNILEDNQIKRPKREAVSFSNDYYHRVWTVDFFVAVILWAKEKEYHARDFYYYFQQSNGSNRNNKGGVSLSDNRIDINESGIGYIIPDGVGVIDREEQTPFFFLFEQHNGKDTARILRQIHGHTVAIENGLPSIKYDIQHQGEPVSNRVFLVFEYESCMKATMHRLAKSEDFKPFINHFLFKTNETMGETDFSNGWELVSGKEVEF